MTRKGHETGRCVATQGHYTAQEHVRALCDTAAWACDTAKPGCDTAGGHGHDMAQRTACEGGLGAPGLASWPSCALGAPNQFLTQYTISESLFGTLFIRFFKKKNEITFLKNKIK